MDHVDLETFALVEPESHEYTDGASEVRAVESSHVSAVDEAFSAWKKIDLPSLQRDLDERGILLSEIPSENNNARRKLAELTKEFRKIPDEEKLPHFRILLKSYQSEIDAFAKRSQVAQTAFLEIYRILSDAPDPAPIISAFIQQSHRMEVSQSLELDNKRLKSELDSALNQLGQVSKEAGDAGVLREKLLKQEVGLKQSVAKQVAEREAALEKDYGDRIAAMKERELYLSRQLEAVTTQFTHLRATHTAAQTRLLELSQKSSEETAARAAETEMVAQELDTVRAWLERSEGERRKLSDRVKQLEASGDHQPGAGDAVSSLSDELSVFETTPSPSVALLLSDLDRMRAENANSERMLRDRVVELEGDLEVSRAECEKLRPLLGVATELEKSRKELDVLKTVEFGDAYAVIADDSEMALTTSSPPDSVPLERLLLEKNRRIQGDLADHKMRLETALLQLEAVTNDRDKALSSAEKFQALVTKLEDDLDRISRGLGPSNTSSSSRDMATTSTEDVLTEALENLTSRSISDNLIHEHGGPPARELSERVNEIPNSIVPILTSQRDRYRQKNVELEEKNRVHLTKIGELQRTIDQLKEDNVKLYERTRYLQSYNAAKGVMEGPANVALSIPDRVNYVGEDDSKAALTTRIDMAGSTEHRKGYQGPKSSSNSPLGSSIGAYSLGHDTSSSRIDTYRNEYESRMDPFRRFHTQEQRSLIRNLPPTDRFSLRLANYVFGNRVTRTLFVSYLALLHLFVFALIVLEMMREECRHDHGRCTPVAE
ncbi:hypothetical protein M427DRAFT_470776 [Gonapodya prolifera JEL478]|uniref:Protein CASP n=1 Tax=Gonapodya prolifera (strain JEL478) TaxID=1344416 RepID=A0A139ARN6_GONPJ|nr:hypothetical protein M427DRAFT_470776 [Gonapodya prolifera JEL478]|eukprot:KXS19193.1 hypothetical protein M427DRAFT_470776 [Gonapodya prolifera JEL478]